MKPLHSNSDYSLFTRRQYSLLQSDAVIGAYSDFMLEIIGKRSFLRFEGNDGWADFLVVQTDMDACVEFFVKLIEQNIPFLDSEFKRLEETGLAWVLRSKEIAMEAQKLDADLPRLLVEFSKGWQAHSVSLWRTFVIPEAANTVLERLFIKYIPSQKRNEAVAFYSHPSKKGHLARIAEHLIGESDIKKRVSFIESKYPWIFTTDPFSPEVTSKQYTEYATTFTKAIVSEKTKEGLLPEEVLPVVKMCQDILYLKDHRDEFRRKASFYVQPLVRAIMRRYDVTREQLWFIKPEEILRLATDREGMLHDLQERLKAYLYESDGVKTVFLQGDEAVRESIGRQKMRNVSTVKGIVGAPGKVRGVVQLVLSSEDCKKFKEGRILVATTTNPDYIAAMHKALAFVTDEGGITCHAAIVARELRKPCVVGTKVATQVLKDGDLVEVNAEKGVVTILK